MPSWFLKQVKPLTSVGVLELGRSDMNEGKCKARVIQRPLHIPFLEAEAYGVVWFCCATFPLKTGVTLSHLHLEGREIWKVAPVTTQAKNVL